MLAYPCTNVLAERIACQPLPGRAAQIRFAPQAAENRHFSPAAPDTQNAAVAILLIDDECDGPTTYNLPLIRRPHTMRHHAGQISLPGGRTEPGESAPQTAVRELAEEIGVNPQSITVLGELTPLYVFSSEFVVYPVVMTMPAKQADFTPNPAEVDELITVSLDQLNQPSCQSFHLREIAGRSYQVPHFEVNGQQVWGATSMILSELLATIKSA